jgi:thiamine monophosphate synthase
VSGEPVLISIARIQLASFSIQNISRMPSVDFRLYLVTDRHQTAGRPLVSVVGRAVSAGVRAVQLRERDLPIRELLSLALDLAARVVGHAVVHQ